jgi:4-amino-4-deoxy-L-arabinose transferase-like glycosyltransferase
MATGATATPLKYRIGLGLIAFALMSGLILSRPVYTLQDYDQPFYITVAYDLYRWGTFSNGIIADSESATDTDSHTRPPPGMFFGPVYPVLVYAAMKLDPRFAKAVSCSVEADRDDRDYSTCDRYELPMRLLNALLLAIAVVALAATAEIIFRRRAVFMLTGALALAAIACEAQIFSYVMTEGTIFALYSVFALATVLAWKTGRTRHFLFSGVLLGLLCLTKPSFLIFFPLVFVLGALYLGWLVKPRPLHTWRNLLVFALAFGCLIGAWMTRNYVTVGKFALTEEYGAAALVERFAYNDMSVREFFQAFPYCTPGLGELAFDQVKGTDSMHRFVYWTKGSFFQMGRDRRDALIDKYQRLDPLIGGIVLQELRSDWWKHLLVTIPLVWCGLWVGWLAALLLVPLFVWATIRAVRDREPLFLLYALPPIVNLGLDGLIGNGATRYNLILIGPYAIGAASLISLWLEGGHWRWQSPAPTPLSAPSAPAVSDAGSA